MLFIQDGYLCRFIKGAISSYRSYGSQFNQQDLSFNSPLSLLPSFTWVWAFHVLPLHLTNQTLPLDTISQSYLCCQTENSSPFCCQRLFLGPPPHPSSALPIQWIGSTLQDQLPCSKISRLILPPSAPVSRLHRGGFFTYPNFTSSWWNPAAKLSFFFEHMAINLHCCLESRAFPL